MFMNREGKDRWVLLGEYKKVLLLLAPSQRFPRPAPQLWYKSGRRRKWLIL